MAVIFGFNMFAQDGAIFGVLDINQDNATQTMGGGLELGMAGRERVYLSFLGVRADVCGVMVGFLLMLLGFGATYIMSTSFNKCFMVTLALGGDNLFPQCS